MLARGANDYRSWEKVPGHPVCDADIEADALLHERLMALDPEAGWLSEETVDSAERLTRVRVWVVDPIDGTRDFLKGKPGWAVSIALVEGGRPILGVLDAPARGEHWRALAGGGATRNGVPLVASRHASLTGARVPADALPRAESELVLAPKPNSIALRMAMVAADEADLLVSTRWGHEWDIAAAALIVEEAGGAVSDGRGRPLRYNSTRGESFGVLACSAAIHAAAVKRFADYAAKGFAKRL